MSRSGSSRCTGVPALFCGRFECPKRRCNSASVILSGTENRTQRAIVGRYVGVGSVRGCEHRREAMTALHCRHVQSASAASHCRRSGSHSTLLFERNRRVVWCFGHCALLARPGQSHTHRCEHDPAGQVAAVERLAPSAPCEFSPLSCDPTGSCHTKPARVRCASSAADASPPPTPDDKQSVAKSTGERAIGLWQSFVTLVKNPAASQKLEKSWRVARRNRHQYFKRLWGAFW